MNDLMLPNPLISSFSTGQSDLKSIKQFQIDALNASQQSLFHLAITESKRLNELSAKIAACPVAEDSALAKIKELIRKKMAQKLQEAKTYRNYPNVGFKQVAWNFSSVCIYRLIVPLID